jgi:hypothetical protein
MENLNKEMLSAAVTGCRRRTCCKDANGDTPVSWGSWHLRNADVLRLLMYEGIPGIH